MKYKEIGMMPTTLKRDRVEADLASINVTKGWHESLFRSFHILAKVKELLKKGTCPEVTLELIELMESTDLEPYAMAEEAYKFQSEEGFVRTSEGPIR